MQPTPSRPTSRSAARDELQALIVEQFSRLDSEQLIARLDGARIANARINDMHEVWQHPQLAARKRWTEVATPAGPIPALLPPGSNSGFTPRMDAVPALGQHTDAILGELGCDAAAIDALRAAGAV